jgi:hypothetical protein
MISPLVAVRELQIPFRGDLFRVDLRTPHNASGMVFLLRDNGNVVGGNALALTLRQLGFGTAICHLLTDAERARAAAHRRVPLCTELLARRLMAAVDAVGDEAGHDVAAAGIAASGIAAAAALRVATFRPFAFEAIACRHARIASSQSLAKVRAATLFLAVAGDLARIRPMTRAFQQLQCAKLFEIVPSGSPSFDDERSFAQACDLTAAWMRKHIAAGHSMNVSNAIAAMPPEISVV